MSVCRGQGIVTAATEVDHVVPHRGDIALMFDLGNLQALCAHCHARKTASETGWGRRPNVLKDLSFVHDGAAVDRTTGS